MAGGQQSEPTGRLHDRASRSWLGLSAQVAAVFVIVTLTCWPWRPISGNEPDTVSAARQWADPTWLPDDWYLNLDIPYRVPFNLVVGPVSAHWGLEAGSALGRLITFALLAGALVALLRALRISVWVGLLPLAIYLGSPSLGADERMVGMADAKAFAYPFGVAALAAVVSRRYRLAAAMAGLAMSFHVLVGLMHVAALAVAVLVQRRHRPAGSRRPRAADLWPLAVTGSWGLWTAWRTLTESLSSAGGAGWDIYTTFRIPRHVLPSAWAPAPLVPWQLWLIGATIAALLLIWRGSERAAPAAGFVLGACTFHLLGLVVYALGEDSLLRYYWFRLADTWVPLGAALVVAGILTALSVRRGRWVRTLTTATAAALALAVAVPTFVDRRARVQDELSREAASDRYRLFSWVADNLPPDAVVVVDPDQLQWYPQADRAAWALYKSSPQSADDVLVWSRRLELATGVPIQAGTTRRELTSGERSLGTHALARLRGGGATHYVAERADAPDGTVLLHREGTWAAFVLQ